jgi:hypothetical protein
LLASSVSGRPPLALAAKAIAAKARNGCTLVRNCTLELNLDHAKNDIDGIVYTIGDAAREARQAMYLPPGKTDIKELNTKAPRAILVGNNDEPAPAYMSRYAFRISNLDEGDIRFSGIPGVRADPARSSYVDAAVDRGQLPSYHHPP